MLASGAGRPPSSCTRLRPALYRPRQVIDSWVEPEAAGAAAAGTTAAQPATPGTPPPPRSSAELEALLSRRLAHPGIVATYQHATQRVIPDTVGGWVGALTCLPACQAGLPGHLPSAV